MLVEAKRRFRRLNRHPSRVLGVHPGQRVTLQRALRENVVVRFLPREVPGAPEPYRPDGANVSHREHYHRAIRSEKV